MKITKQINDYTCVLACIQSFLADHGMDVTQQQMIEDFPDLCNKGNKIEGAFTMDVDGDNLKKLGEKYGFERERADSLSPLPNEALLILTTDLNGQGVKHCVRFRRHAPADKIEIMNPNINRHNEREEFDTWAKKSLHDWKCVLIKLKRN